MTNKQKRSSSRRRNTPLKEVKSKKLKALIKMAAMQQSIQKKITTSKQIQKQNLAKYQWQAFFLTYILYICFYLARKPFSTIKDTLKTPNQLKSTPLTDDDLGQIETVFLVAYAGAQFIIGPFGDKYGARKLLFVALIGTSVACYMMSVAESLFDLRLAWGMNGIFQAAAFPLMMKALSPWYDNNTRAIMLGYWTTCQQIGGTVAVSLAGYIASGGFDRAWFGAQSIGTCAGGEGAECTSVAIGPEATCVATMDDTAGGDTPCVWTSTNTTTWRDSFLLPAVVAGIAAVVTLTMMIEHPKDVGLKTPTDNSNKKHQKKNRSKKKMNLFEQVHGSNYWSGIPIGGDDRAITEGRYEEYGLKAPVTKERYEENVAISRKNRAALKAALNAATTISYMEVARLPYLFNVGMAYFCIKLVRYTMLIWSISYLKEVHHYNTTDAANMSTLFDIGGAFGAVACAMIAKRFFNGNRIHAVFVLCIVSGICTGTYGIVASFGSITNMMMLFVAGFMIAGPDSVLGGAACSDVCERAGYDTSVLTTASGIANGMGSLGAILAGAGPVWIKSQYGWNGLFLVAGGLAMLGALFLLPLVREMMKDGDTEVVKKKKKKA